MLGDKGERVRSARLESVRCVVECGRREQVAFILLAGDTFEDNGVERIKVREVAKILGGGLSGLCNSGQSRPIYARLGLGGIGLARLDQRPCADGRGYR